MKNIILLAIGLPILFSSCIQQKYIFKGNTLSTLTTIPTEPMATDSIYIYKVKTPFKSMIEVKGDYIIITTIDKKNLTLANSTKLVGGATGAKKDFIDKYYFPETETQTEVRNLRYFDTQPVLQGLSIPLKIRPQLKNAVLLDSFPSQTETGFNPAIAFGWKLNLNSYSSSKDLFGNNLKKFSITPGWFMGTGAVDLKKANTRNPVIAFERKAALLSTGGFIMFGYNKINVGYSFGWDYATGTGRNDWLYQGEMWHGLIIGLDIIK